MRHAFLVALGLGLLHTAGCGGADPARSTGPAGSAVPRAAVKLTLLVMGDPDLAAGARLLRGEWAERSGGELVVQETTLEELLDAGQLTADLVIYPSRHVGELVARDWLRPVRETVLKDETFAFDDLLPLVRNQAMRFGGQVAAVSLGETPLLVARPDEAADPAGEAFPETWEQFDKSFSDTAQEGQLAVELIARAASGVDASLRAELLFDLESMAPRLTSPPFVRAWEELTARATLPRRVGSSIQLSWPTSSSLEGHPHWQFASLPRAAEVYNTIFERWEPQPGAPSLAVLGFGGRSLSVTTASRNATSAFKLLTWLGSGTIASGLSSRSHATIWFRHSQRARADRWLKERAGKEVVPLVTRLLAGDHAFLLPRLPGIDRYLQALEEELARAIQGEIPPRQALEAATRRWNALTGELGREQQRQSYRFHLGLDVWMD